MRTRHIHTRAIDPDLAAYISGLEQAAFSLQDALTDLKCGSATVDHPKVTRALQEFDLVQRQGRQIFAEV